MQIDMRADLYLWITFNLPEQDRREVIIDKAKGDVRICDGQHIVKVTSNQFTKQFTSVLVDDQYVWTAK
ncbi:MAG TPA: hypothetical protein VMW64_02375 [Dehalococcoidia bacterium]|nr:hypothetical protein [Dehalococcoidia bacterium]